MKIAFEVASMGTCARRSVGVVLVDDRNIILATGHNGPPSKWPHCMGTAEEGSVKCPGATATPGKDLDLCYANHAELNALIHCPDTTKIRTCYTTTSPCINCVKALLCTDTSRIVFFEEYPHPEAIELWTRYCAPNKLPRTWEACVGGEVLVRRSSANRKEVERTLAGAKAILDSTQK